MILSGLNVVVVVVVVVFQEKEISCIFVFRLFEETWIQVYTEH